MTSYSLLTSYTGQSLISGFNFIDTPDLTHGFVSYQSYSNAASAGLVSVNPNTQAVTFRVDTTNTYDPSGSQGGRPSVRIESKAAYNQVLVVGDFAHMPSSTCGAWPAFWMYGPNWPNNGEVDIIEGGNMAYQNLISAHTTPDCSLPSSGSWTGAQDYLDCSSVSGCNYLPPASDTSSYGDGFNSAGGGAYALLWTDNAIRVWHFSRGSIPQDITSKQPNPSSWGVPQALFGTSSCDVSSHFANMSIVLNTDMCGDYAGNAWSTSSCSGYAPTCEDFIGNNPSKLTNLYWEVNYIDVYNPTSASKPSSPAPKPSHRPSIVLPAPSSEPAINASRAHTSSTTARVPHAATSRSKNSKTTAASSSVSTPVRRNPASIGSFSYLGCFSSGSGYSTFSLTSSSNSMTLEKCTGLCSKNKYAGVAGKTCYCTNELDADTSPAAKHKRCNTPCPGDSTEDCGSISGDLRTLYVNRKAASFPVPPPAPAMAGSRTGVVVITRTITATIVYTTVCSTNPGQLVPVTAAVTYCATGTANPPVPHSTVTQSCNKCGANGQSLVTLTVPVDVVNYKTNTYTINAISSAAISHAAAAAAAAAASSATTAPQKPLVTPTFSLPVQASASRMGVLNAILMLATGAFAVVFLI